MLLNGRAGLLCVWHWPRERSNLLEAVHSPSCHHGFRDSGGCSSEFSGFEALVLYAISFLSLVFSRWVLRLSREKIVYCGQAASFFFGLLVVNCGNEVADLQIKFFPKGNIILVFLKQYPLGVRESILERNKQIDVGKIELLFFMEEYSACFEMELCELTKRIPNLLSMDIGESFGIIF